MAKHKQKQKRKRNYKAERKAAGDFADAVLFSHRLPAREWLDMWAVIYRQRLAQIRLPLGEGED